MLHFTSILVLLISGQSTVLVTLVMSKFGIYSFITRLESTI
jgi:hypothetical protein